jgi:hypothetical protein
MVTSWPHERGSPRANGKDWSSPVPLSSEELGGRRPARAFAASNRFWVAAFLLFLGAAGEVKRHAQKTRLAGSIWKETEMTHLTLNNFQSRQHYLRLFLRARNIPAGEIYVDPEPSKNAKIIVCRCLGLSRSDLHEQRRLNVSWQFRGLR